MSNYTTFLGGFRMSVFTMADMTKIYRQRIFFSSQNLDAGNGDVHQVIPVTAGDIVHRSWINVKTACPAGSTVDLGYGTVTDLYGNGLALDATGIASTILAGTLARNFYLVPKGGQIVEEIEVDGAAIGDLAVVNIPAGANIGDLAITAEVLRPNIVTVHLLNNTHGEIDLPESLTLQAIVDKAPRAISPWIVAANDTIDVKATLDTADMNISSGVIDVYAMITRF
jgi:hypothetical protein